MIKFAFVIACVILLWGSGGCGFVTKAEHDATLATVKRAESNISEEHLEWSGAIAQQPGAKALPDLSAFTPEQRAAWYRARETRKQQLDRVLTPTTQPTP